MALFPTFGPGFEIDHDARHPLPPYGAPIAAPERLSMRLKAVQLSEASQPLVYQLARHGEAPRRSSGSAALDQWRARARDRTAAIVQDGAHDGVGLETMVQPSRLLSFPVRAH